MYYITTGNRVYNSWYFGEIVFLCNEIILSVQRSLSECGFDPPSVPFETVFQIRGRYYILYETIVICFQIYVYIYIIHTSTRH